MRTADARQPGGFGFEPEPQGGVNPLLLVHRLLRGRYWWAIGLSVVLGGPLAWLGYRSKTPMYTSEAIVRIAPTQSPILFQTEQNEAMPYFDQYVNGQAALMGSQETLFIALGKEPMAEAGWEAGNAGLAALRRAVSVRAPARAGMLQLAVSHPNPAAAQAACESILQVYMQFYDTQSGLVLDEQQKALNTRIINREGVRETNLRIVRDIAEARGTEQLQPTIDSLSREVAELDVRMAQVRAALAIRGVDVNIDPAQGSSGATGTATPGVSGIEEGGGPPAWTAETVPVEMLAEGDPELTELLRASRRLEAEIEAFTAQYSNRHLEVRTRESELRRVSLLIQQREEFLRATWGQGPDLVSATNAELLRQYEQDRRQRVDMLQNLSSLASDQRRLVEARDAANRAETERLEASRRLDELLTEQSRESLGRVTVLQAATTPLAPSSDKRLMFAAAGAMAGGGAAFGLVGLLGLLGGGFRYIDEIDEKSSQLLGVIPDLGGRREPTPEAALCIHHARAMIDSRVPRVKERGRIIAVTSPTAGDGKTTVCCSLATSFAMAGFRTVVLDADFVGRGMTSRLEMDKAAGLADVLAGDDLESALAPGGTENLLIIGAGREERLSADRFSAARLAPVLERLSRAHDIVLVDSGPVLGSIEATVTVGLADAVLGVVSRGQSEKMFASMRRKLESLGAELTGVVFNRAMPRDFQHSTHTSVVSAQSQRSRTVQVPDFVTMGASGMAGRLPGGSGGGSDAGGSGGGTGQWSSSRDRATAESD